MPWIVGVDEAGYGPNLGPFVMTSVACRVPEELAEADLWRALRRGVRRHGAGVDRRLVVEDSKLVHSGPNAFRDLERNVLGALAAWPVGVLGDVLDYLDRACPGAHAELSDECWFDGASTFPMAAEPADYLPAGKRFAATCMRRRITWGLVRSQVLCPRRFNALTDRWGSKGAVLALSLIELVRCNHHQLDDSETMYFLVDKHGGRNTYGPMLQHALPEGLVLTHEEGAECSVYSVKGLSRAMRLTIAPRSDSSHLCVALASMISKYLREVLMREFNRFWRGFLPDLKATAGYPGDSARYYQAIKPVARRLGVPEECLWRKK